jgi:DNA-binding MarR family transcriptional regulator
VPRKPETPLVATELRVVIGRLIRRLRADNTFPVSQAVVLSRLEREGPLSVSELATAERVRPQSMAQTVTDLESEGLVERRPDPDDRRRAPVQLTGAGLRALHASREQREGWLAQVIENDFTEEEQKTLREAIELLRRLAES